MIKRLFLNKQTVYKDLKSFILGLLTLSGICITLLTVIALLGKYFLWVWSIL